MLMHSIELIQTSFGTIKNLQMLHWNSFLRLDPVGHPTWRVSTRKERIVHYAWTAMVIGCTHSGTCSIAGVVFTKYSK